MNPVIFVLFEACKYNKNWVFQYIQCLSYCTCYSSTPLTWFWFTTVC